MKGFEYYDEKMGEHKLHYLLFLVGIIVFLTLIIFVDPVKVYRTILASKKSYMIISSLFLILGLLIRSGKIYIILNLFKDDVPPKRCFAYYVNSSVIANIIPARMGESLISILIKKNDKIEISKTLPLLFADKIFDLLIIFFYFCLAYLILLWHPLNIYMCVGIIGVVAISATSNFHKKVQEIRNNLKFGIVELVKRPKYLMFFSFLTLIGWLPEFGSFYFCMRAVGLDITYFQMIFLHSSALFAGIISMIPAGIGSVEISILAISTKFGFSKEMIIAGTLLYRFVAYFTLGLLWILINRFSFKLSKKEEAVI